jgi:hypothetical protein
MTHPPPANATYLGDGVYCWDDGYHLWISTERGIDQWVHIALEREVYDALVKVGARYYAPRLKAEP